MTGNQIVRRYIVARVAYDAAREVSYRARGRAISKRAAELSQSSVELSEATAAVRDLLAKRGGPVYHRPTDTLLLLMSRPGRSDALLVYSGLTDATGRKLK